MTISGKNSTSDRIPVYNCATNHNSKYGSADSTSTKSMVTMNNNDALLAVLDSEAEAMKHVILIYDELESFRMFYSEYAKSLLEKGKAVAICPSAKEPVESVLPILQKSGTNVDFYIKTGSNNTEGRRKRVF